MRRVRTAKKLQIQEPIQSQPPTTAIAVQPPLQPTLVRSNQAADAAAVRPVVSAEQAKALWDEYIETCRAILRPEDYTYYVCSRSKEGKEQKPVAFRTREAA